MPEKGWSYARVPVSSRDHRPRCATGSLQWLVCSRSWRDWMLTCARSTRPFLVQSVGPGKTSGWAMFSCLPASGHGQGCILRLPGRWVPLQLLSAVRSRTLAGPRSAVSLLCPMAGPPCEAYLFNVILCGSTGHPARAWPPVGPCSATRPLRLLQGPTRGVLNLRSPLRLWSADRRRLPAGSCSTLACFRPQTVQRPGACLLDVIPPGWRHGPATMQDFKGLP